MFSVKLHFCFLTGLFLILAIQSPSAEAQINKFEGWDTDISNRSIDLDELNSGGPTKDGIPSIDRPAYISQEQAGQWMADREPVIAVNLNGIARAYPLQILMWHEIVNTRFDELPVSVTFCPLCYSALVFDRRIEGKVLEFGVSGFLRHSDLVMFDRSTESLWQQITGEAIVGTYTGSTLQKYPSQIISFGQFRKIHPEGKVLSRDTGYDREYGRNPYVGYDDIDKKPMLVDEAELDGRLRPMEKVIGVQIGDHKKAYPYSLTESEKIINDKIGEVPVVVFHIEGAASALDASRIMVSKDAGSTGVFLRELEGQTLQFEYKRDQITDRDTESTWNITGEAVDGPLKGHQLEPAVSGDYFAFAWLIFHTDSDIYRQE